jgi:hypothetical protein
VSEKVKRARNWARLAESEEYETLCEARVGHAVPVRQPLVLVSQVYRSGGTLLSQLFDGHPEVHAHPHELRIGSPTSRDWIDVDLAAPETWFESLYERYANKHFKAGYSKTASLPEEGDQDVYPFLFLPRLQKQLFEAFAEEWAPDDERGVLDCYFTSYFNAWLDNQTLYHEPKRVITAFAPELNLKRDSLGRYFESYPDGTYVAIVRDPRSWYASARKQKARDLDVERALKRWRKSAQAALEARERHADRVLILAYDDLVLRTEKTMRVVAEALGLSWSDTLLEPTFNGRPIRANSSHRVAGHGVLRDRTHADLDPETAELVDFWARGVYEQVFPRT